jgi:alpha-glucosidase
VPGRPEIDRNLQIHSADQPEIHHVIAEMRAVMEEYDERLLIGEIYLPLERLMTYYGEGGSGVHLPFNFQLIQTPWRADRVAEIGAEYEAALPEHGWPNWVLSNHDQPRIAARAGEAQARVAAMLLLTLRGTPTIYYGDELGIGDVDVPHDRIQDPWAKQEPDSSFNRDKARTPMQWLTEPHAGFSPAEPWLPLTADWQTRNVEAAERESGSMLQLYRSLLQLRRHSAFRTGAWRPLATRDDVFAYEREDENGRFAVLLNFASTPRATGLHPAFDGGAILCSTDANRTGAAADPLLLGPDEGVVIAAKGR